MIADAATRREERLRAELAFIVDYIDEHRYPPSVREIMSAAGVASLDTVQRDLVMIRHRQWVTSQQRQPRTLVVTDEGMAVLGR